MFSSLLFCLFDYVLVTLWKNGWTEFHEIFRRDRYILYHSEQYGAFWGLHTGFYSFCFGGNSHLLATLWNNGWTEFHEIFRTGRIWDNAEVVTFWRCRVWPLYPGSIFFITSLIVKTSAPLPETHNNKLRLHKSTSWFPAGVSGRNHQSHRWKPCPDPVHVYVNNQADVRENKQFNFAMKL